MKTVWQPEFCSWLSTYTWEKQYPKARLGKT